tara:strand:+ start:1833 stop:2123 length:291 start_codon:yes stop_codon:yes gene_type:complete
METISAKEFDRNPNLPSVVEPDNDLKNFLVEYTGETLDPSDSQVTVEMIVEVMAKEFPEFVLALAEENWVRGYQQALDDVDTGRSMLEGANNDKQE